MKLVIETQLGTLRGECASEAWMRAAVGPVLGAVFEPGKALREISLGNTRAWFKGSHLQGKTKLRYAVRSKLFWQPTPRVREFRNLAWLVERVFQAPKPLAAGVLERHGLPTYQFLCTEIAPEGTAFDAALLAAGPSERAALITECAREFARLHALHFAHRDLFARNLRVAPASESRRLWFVDCWRGKPDSSRRAAAYDLGCWMVDAAGAFTRAEQLQFFAAYFEERASQGAPAPSTKLLRAAAQTRQRWLARIAKDPARSRSNVEPAKSWDWKALAAELGAN